MRVLIAHSDVSLGMVWRQHLTVLGADVTLVTSGTDALQCLQDMRFHVIVLDFVLSETCALTVAEFAQFHQPRANVVFVTDTAYFADGSIFAYSANARALVETQTPPDDLAAIVDYYGHEADQRPLAG